MESQAYGGSPNINPFDVSHKKRKLAPKDEIPDISATL